MKYLFFFSILILFSDFNGEKSLIIRDYSDEITYRQKSTIQNLVSNDKYNDSLFFFLDFSKSSTKKRFYIFDIRQDSVLHRGLVANGTCDKAPRGTVYSNQSGSHCSSLGLYSVGQSYYGKWGLSYRLHGLQSSNSNAFSRYVVLHSHSCVPDNDSPYPICESWGCPTVSPHFLKTLAGLIDQSEKPILLYIEDKDAKS